MKKLCNFCNQQFNAIKKNQKYCNKRCREKDWVKNNSDRDKLLKKKWRDKQDVICRRCQLPIALQNRASGVTYCSDKCRNESRLEQSRKFSKEKHSEFSEYKKNISCQSCGYNRCGASLDFHHVEEHEKERRIDAKMWAAQTQLIKDEIDKCILVCKNCHYEIHNGLLKVEGTNGNWKITENGDVY